MERNADNFAQGWDLSLVDAKDHEQLDEQEIGTKMGCDPDPVVQVVSLVPKEKDQ